MIPFWSFIFPETYISCIYYSRQVGELTPRKLNSRLGYGFFKKGFKSNRFQVIVWSQNLRFSYFSFLKGFPAKKMASHALTVLKPSHAIDLLPAGCEWSEKVKVKKSDPFLVLYFSWNYIYYISCVYLYFYVEEKVHNYLMSLIFSTSWRVAFKKFKFRMGIWIF